MRIGCASQAEASTSSAPVLPLRMRAFQLAVGSALWVGLRRCDVRAGSTAALLASVLASLEVQVRGGSAPRARCVPPVPDACPPCQMRAPVSLS